MDEQINRDQSKVQQASIELDEIVSEVFFYPQRIENLLMNAIKTHFLFQMKSMYVRMKKAPITITQNKD